MQRWWWKGYLFYEKWVHQKADFNFFISEEDKKYALKHFKLLPDRCAAITYGAEPYIQKSNGERQLFLQELDISETCCLFFFNGTMDYRPNYEAVQILMEEVAPRLRMKHLNFKILLSGNRISSELRKQIEEHPDFHFLDYATDVNLIYQSAQLFLNPMPFASGVKTKVIEAIGNQSTVISTVSGATGLNKQACGPKLITVADGDWDGFVQCIMELMVQPFTPTPLSFWEQYAWDRIVQKAAVALNNVIHPHAAH
jgi:glycosyltransferase involved in cell wall biosynthesis